MPYKVDLLGEYDVNAIFNVSDLFLFDIGQWFEKEYFLGEREWCDPSNTKRFIRGFSWFSDKT